LSLGSGVEKIFAVSCEHIFRELLELWSKFVGKGSFRSQVESVGFFAATGRD
jgi:hypothetical protein